MDTSAKNPRGKTRKPKLTPMTPKVSNNQTQHNKPDPKQYAKVVTLMKAAPTGKVNANSIHQKRQSTILLQQKKQDSTITRVERLTRKLETLIAKNATPELLKKIRNDIQSAQAEHDESIRKARQASNENDSPRSRSPTPPRSNVQKHKHSAQFKVNDKITSNQNPQSKMEQMRQRAKEKEEDRKRKVATAKNTQALLQRVPMPNKNSRMSKGDQAP